ncbi:hypothetical protein ACFQPF_11575 [Fictibacillus iocasae]|uniref:DUF3993 domain-containing protein n=1 Tax=Fictibacillus iocasae TaxID=2715437 RepID=A0ABW2NSL5_9BACL
MKKGFLLFLSLVMAISIWGSFGANKATAATAVREKIYLERAHKLQWSLYNEREFTKARIYATMSKGFTKEFIDQFFQYYFKKAGVNAQGEQLYYNPAGDNMTYSVTRFTWNKKDLYGKQKYPAVNYTVIGSRLYVSVSQYQFDAMMGNHVYTVKMVKKKNSREPLRVYAIQRQYE